MALTANWFPIEATRRGIAPQARNTSVFYANALAAIGSQSHGTAAAIGRAYPWTAAAGDIPVGHCEIPVTGTGSSANLAQILAEGRVLRVAVTGTSAYTNSVGRWVFASDDGTYTLTRAAPNCLPVGFIVDWHTGTTCDVYFLSLGELLAVMAAGGIHRNWHIGVFVPEATASGNLLTGIVAPCHGSITSVYAICSSAPADADVAGTVNLEIGGVDVTGGVVTVNFADTLSLKLAGTAVTAANVFHEGDLIDVEWVKTADGTVNDGQYSLYCEYDILPGL